MLFFVLLALLNLYDCKEDSKPRSVNLALETVLEFNNEDNSADIQIIDRVKNFLDRVKSIIDTKPSRRSSHVNKNAQFSDFVRNAIIIISKFNDDDLENFIDVADNEIRKYHYKGCKFYELIENHNVRRSMANKLESYRDTPVTEIRDVLAKARKFIELDLFTEEQRKIIDYINSLYAPESRPKLKNLLHNLSAYQIHSKRNNLDLGKIVRDGLRSVIFDHYSNLDSRTRKDLKIRLETYWQDYSHPEKSEYHVWKLQPFDTTKKDRHVNKHIDSGDFSSVSLEAKKVTKLKKSKHHQKVGEKFDGTMQIKHKGEKNLRKKPKSRDRQKERHREVESDVETVEEDKPRTPKKGKLTFITLYPEAITFLDRKQRTTKQSHRDERAHKSKSKTRHDAKKKRGKIRKSAEDDTMKSAEEETREILRERKKKDKKVRTRKEDKVQVGARKDNVMKIEKGILSEAKDTKHSDSNKLSEAQKELEGEATAETEEVFIEHEAEINVKKKFTAGMKEEVDWTTLKMLRNQDHSRRPWKHNKDTFVTKRKSRTKKHTKYLDNSVENRSTKPKHARKSRKSSKIRPEPDSKEQATKSYRKYLEKQVKSTTKDTGNTTVNVILRINELEKELKSVKDEIVIDQKKKSSNHNLDVKKPSYSKLDFWQGTTKVNITSNFTTALTTLTTKTTIKTTVKTANVTHKPKFRSSNSSNETQINTASVKNQSAKTTTDSFLHDAPKNYSGVHMIDVNEDYKTDNATASFDDTYHDLGMDDSLMMKSPNSSLTSHIDHLERVMNNTKPNDRKHKVSQKMFEDLNKILDETKSNGTRRSNSDDGLSLAGLAADPLEFLDDMEIK